MEPEQKENARAEQEKAKLLFISAPDCPACNSYKAKYWKNDSESVKSKLREKYPQVDLIEIILPSKKEKPDPQKYPKDLHRFARWFPTFILITGESWLRAQPADGGENDSRLEGAVYYGDLRGDLYYLKPSPPMPSDRALFPWLDEQLRSSIFTSDGGSTVPHTSTNNAGRVGLLRRVNLVPKVSQ